MDLVSIVVVTYNFQEIILECLNSITKQSYKNLEVIISDDCSKDNTVEICKKWKKENESRFNIKILISDKNEGVTKNINKGAKEAKGNWIKFLAGDDILCEDSIENFIRFINLNKSAEIIFSRVELFKKTNNKYKKLKILPEDNKIEYYFKLPKNQLKIILDNNFIVTPSMIIKNDLLKRMNYFDEKFRMVEDYPFWIKLLKNNIKFYFLDRVTVFYRQSGNSVSGKKENLEVNPLMAEFEEQFYKEIYKKEIKNPFKRWDRYLKILRNRIILNNGNRHNFLSRYIRKLKSKNLIKYGIVMLFFIILFILKNK